MKQIIRSRKSRRIKAITTCQLCYRLMIFRRWSEIDFDFLWRSQCEVNEFITKFKHPQLILNLKLFSMIFIIDLNNNTHRATEREGERESEKKGRRTNVVLSMFGIVVVVIIAVFFSSRVLCVLSLSTCSPIVAFQFQGLFTSSHNLSSLYRTGFWHL